MPGAQLLHRVSHNRQVATNLPAPAAGEKGHERFSVIQPVCLEQLLPASRRSSQSSQRMTNVIGGNRIGPKELFFERKDAQKLGHVSAKLLYPASAPRP